MDGILNINKPQGRSSFSMVTLVRRLSGERHVGHAGSLDPIATGVLPVCLGRGTRVTEYLMEATKVYRTQIELGVATDTYDITGRVTSIGDASQVDHKKLETALASFRGSIEQTPPMYSALKHHGKRLYELARAGIEVERKSRPIIIYRLELVDFASPLITIEVECSKGTYIRSLAHDLGMVLGCGATMKSLTRLRCGPFDIKDAVSVSQLEDDFGHGRWETIIHPIDVVLSHWAAMVVDGDMERMIRHGRPIPGSSPEGDYCRVYTRDGCFLGVLRFKPETGEWQPDKVFL
ncbi:tRNA pseudouridine(55) synthase TruB [Chloroflexota bacterium]